MKQYTVTFLPDELKLPVNEGTTLLQAQIDGGLRPDAPCGGKGTCGKCKVWVDGQEVLACQTPVDRDMVVTIPHGGGERILTQGLAASAQADGANRYAIAFDIGTTTVVGYLLDGRTGAQLANASCMNPQAQFGADVISRIQHAMDGHGDELKNCIRQALASLTRETAKQARIDPAEITVGSIVGNTAMHHLLLGIDPRPLVTPPYMPAVYDAQELPAEGLLPISGTVRIAPNIAGFVGGDTVGCLVATRFDELEELTLMIDIGTNGEMVLGNRHHRIACSTAAGPAFEGAKISCGMRGAAGAVDHVWLQDGKVAFHVIGDGKAVGLCGSGLLDLVAVLLDTGDIEEAGRMPAGSYTLEGTEVTLLQKDVREVQLAKSAIRAGIELLAEKLGRKVEDIERVDLAGAFGNYMNPASACRIGLIPPVLLERIVPIGNAAGEGSKACALSAREFAHSDALAKNTEFLELASMPQFQDRYIDCLEFSEEDDE